MYFVKRLLFVSIAMTSLSHAYIVHEMMSMHAQKGRRHANNADFYSNIRNTDEANTATKIDIALKLNVYLLYDK